MMMEYYYDHYLVIRDSIDQIYLSYDYMRNGDDDVNEMMMTTMIEIGEMMSVVVVAV